jgi:hypothetical protein
VRRYDVRDDGGNLMDFENGGFPLWVHGLWSDDDKIGRRQVMGYYLGRDGAGKLARFFNLKDTDRRVQVRVRIESAAFPPIPPPLHQHVVRLGTGCC